MAAQKLNRSLRYCFDRHIIKDCRPKIHTMEHFGFKNDQRFAMTEPFKLFNDEAVDHIRNLTCDAEFIKEYLDKTPFASYVLRGVSRHSGFMGDFYNCPEICKYLSGLTGEGMAWHPMVLEGGDFNIQDDVSSDEPIVDWHIDSVPFVLLVDFSHHPENSEGGGTWFKKNDTGEITKIRYPGPGYATIFRGSAVLHKAAHANYRRTIFAASLVHTDVSKTDRTDVLRSSQFNDYRKDLYEQFLNFRLDRLQNQMRVALADEDLDRRLKFQAVIDEEMAITKNFANSCFESDMN